MRQSQDKNIVLAASATHYVILEHACGRVLVSNVPGNGYVTGRNSDVG